MNRTRKLSVMTAVLILAVFAAGWFLLVAPKLSDAAALRDKVTKQEQANQTIEAQIVTLQALAKDLPSKTAELAALHRQLPADPALPSLIRNLTAAARASGVELVSLAPTAPTALAPAGAPATVADPKAAASEAVFQIPLVLALEGGYFELEHFLSKLEALKRAMLVTGFDVASAPAAAAVGTGTAADGDTNNLTMSVKARVFMRSQPTAVAPVAGAVAAPTGTASPAATAGATPAATGAAGPTPTPTN